MRRSMAGASSRLRNNISCGQQHTEAAVLTAQRSAVDPARTTRLQRPSSSSIHSSARIGSWNHKL